MKKYAALLAALAMVVVASVAFAADAPAPAAAGAPAADQGPKVGPNVGDKMKPFKLPTPIDKGSVALEDLTKNGKDTILIFMQTACSLCVAEVREMSEAAEDMKPNANVVLVSVDYDANRIQAYQQAYNVPYPILHDKEADVLESLRFSATPATAIIDGKGLVKAKLDGYDKAKVKGLIKQYSK